MLHLDVLLPDGTVDTLTGTEEHPFWVPDQGAWVPLAKLETGTVLRTSSGGDAVVLGMEAVPGFTDVFNFEIAGVHNYFVRGSDGDEPGVLVHNGCGQTVVEESSRRRAMDAGQRHAQVPRESRGGEAIGFDELGESSRGRNFNEIQANGGTDLGRRDPNSSAEFMDHPDGHPHMTGPDQPDHHGTPHVNATNAAGEELVITYPAGQ